VSKSAKVVLTVPHNIDRILTTHVGSLIRPPNLIEFWHLIDDGKPYEDAAFEACLTESVIEVVRQQADVGIDIVSDGEFSKGLNLGVLHFQTASRASPYGRQSQRSLRTRWHRCPAARTAERFPNSMPSTIPRRAWASGSAIALLSTSQFPTRARARSPRHQEHHGRPHHC
jgi:hypothetical protein